MTHNPFTSKKAQDFAADNDWDGYFKAVLGKPPRDTLLKALEHFDADPPSTPHTTRLAVDLACGEGRDTLELLNRGWRVHAIDMTRSGLDMLNQRVKPEQKHLLQTQLATFAASRWDACDFLNCSYALPFCPPADFDELWQRIVMSIKPGGRFAGQLFGERDTWSRSSHTLGHTRTQVEQLLSVFHVEMLNEEEKDDKTSMGDFKHWHVFHIVAKKSVT
ncbi:MAG: class I SAM-dependent methyltransferase [Pyrinomonadaceae bacterium]|nr:class I SAM-dependent methyltransferase [Phycisphaerales bacterium]